MNMLKDITKKLGWSATVKESITYEIIVRTSKHYSKGSTDSTVSIQLVGEDGKTTDWHVLDNFFRDDFEQGRVDEFTINDVDVGRIQVIKLGLKHMLGKDIWACDNVIIKHGEYVDEFPVYDWVFHEIDVIRGDAILPNTSRWNKVKEIIDKEREYNKKRFFWMEKPKPGDAAWMLPRFIPAEDLHNVPHQLRMEDARWEHMSASRSAAKLNVIFTKLQGYLFPIKELDDYKGLITHFRIPNELLPGIERWQEDEEQGSQMLNGANPFAIEICKSLPEYSKITNKHVKGLLNKGKTLEDEIKDGRIFIADYTPWTRGLPRNRRYKSDKMLFCADCHAIFYSPGDGKFRPIAIQLRPDEEEYVFTPNCDKHDWLLAKMFFRCSDTNVHQWIYHFLWGHAIVETVAISMFRCLSCTHPMYKLCRAHLQHVVVINQFARDVLIFDSSPSNFTRSINGSALARKVFEGFNFTDLDLPMLLQKKGLDSDKLQNYHYRHDALLLWDAIKTYVSKIVKIFYRTDQDVENDYQMQDWVQDFAYEGLGWPDGDVRGCPTSLNTVDELISFVLKCVFTSTVLHAATHKPMFDMYKFVPNAPGGMRMSVHKRGEGSMERILDTLPDETMATILLGSAFVLTELPEDEIYLGEFPMDLFIEAEPKQIMEEFRQDLARISEKIKERNKNLKFPYEYLIPETVPTGTTA